MTAGIHHVALTVSDLDRSLQFYTEMLGFEVERWLRGTDAPTRIVLVAVPGGGRLELFHQRDGAQAAPPRTDNLTLGWNHLAFGVADVDAEVTRLQARGVTFRSTPGPKAPGAIRTAFFADPDGNTLELFEA